MSDVSQAQPVQLNVNDLQAVLNVIEIATQRGTFKGAELSSVGQIFDRINTFVTQYTAQQEAESIANTATAAIPETGESKL